MMHNETQIKIGHHYKWDKTSQPYFNAHKDASLIVKAVSVADSNHIFSGVIVKINRLDEKVNSVKCFNSQYFVEFEQPKQSIIDKYERLEKMLKEQ